MRKSYHTKMAAEAFAAGVLAHAGYDVSIQYGADQPRYDLVICREHYLKQISVKGTQVPGWGLMTKHGHETNYHRTIDDWVAVQGPKMIFFLVSFHEIAVGTIPDCWIATAADIGAHMKAQRAGHGSTTLFLHKKYRTGIGAGSTDKIPDKWRFSVDRMQGLFVAK